MQQFIDVATACLELGNFDTTFAVVGGLSSQVVFRLKYTWRDLPKEHRARWERLQRVTGTAANYAAYREALAARIRSGRLCIPFLGVLLSDLVKLHTSITEAARRERRGSSGSHRAHLQQQLPSPPLLHAEAGSATPLKTQPGEEKRAEPVVPYLPRSRSTNAALDEQHLLIHFQKYAAFSSMLSTLTQCQATRPEGLVGDLAVQEVLRMCIFKNKMEDEKTLFDISLNREPRDMPTRELVNLVHVLEDTGFA